MLNIIFLSFFCSSYVTKCQDVFNATPSENAYSVYCPPELPMIFPTSCSCGILPLFRFSSFPGSFPGFGSDCGNMTQYGYARTFCCDTSNWQKVDLNRDLSIDEKIIKLNVLSEIFRKNYAKSL